MAKKKIEFDILSAEGLVTDAIAEMKKKIETSKQEIEHGTQLFDALRKEQKGVIKKDAVDHRIQKIRDAVSDAKVHWVSSIKALNDLDEQIRRELNSADITPVKFTRLKKLQSKNIEAKQKLAGFNVEKIEELGMKVISQITGASRQYFYHM